MNDNKRINAEKFAENCGWMVPGDLGADGVLTFVSATHRTVMRIGDDVSEGAAPDSYKIYFSSSDVTSRLSTKGALNVSFTITPDELANFLRRATEICHSVTSKAHLGSSQGAGEGVSIVASKAQDEASRIIAALPPALQAAAAADPTVREALVKQRRGQDKYREALEKLWSGRCPITGINHQAFLVASHAKPWADSSPAERLDPFNGILLAVHVDRLFDGGWISFTDAGQILLSPALPSDIAVSLLGQGCQERAITQFTPKHSPYLAWHRDKVYRKA
jgi:hypothetical protein